MSPTTRKYVLDTQIFIDAFRDPITNEALQRFHRAFAPFEYLSVVVAQKLRAGVTRDRDRKALERNVLGVFERAGRTFAPNRRCLASFGRCSLARKEAVVADCVNPWPLTRDEWRALAERMRVPVVEVEVVCSDQVEHRRRVESRVADIAGHRVPTWQEVAERDYRPWDHQRLVIDTARRTVPESVQAVVSALPRGL